MDWDKLFNSNVEIISFDASKYDITKYPDYRGSKKISWGVEKQENVRDFQKGDFFDVLASERNFTKLYLSNILTRPYLNTRKVRETIAGLPEGVLLYLVCHL